MGKSIEDHGVPKPTLRRMPAYLRLLSQLQRLGDQAVSCTRIAEELKQDPTQVRKDLAFTGITGKPRVGYDLDELIAKIEHFLGWDNLSDAFLAGAGNLGRALLGYSGFTAHGLNIVAAFDTDPQKVGSQVYNREVLPLEKLPDLARRMHVAIGIITVPAAAAQNVADLMVAGGIYAIWNFAPAQLNVPENVIVEHEHLSATLAVLSRKLAQNGLKNISVPVG